MMEEVSITTADDAYAMDLMSDEEILACLVAESRLPFAVPTKKPKLNELKKKIGEEEKDSLAKYQRENCELQQASLRLEQENDNLAYKLITSKIDLRNSLDKVEDRVDELNKKLLYTRRSLQATEEEKRGKDEEAAMLKEVFQRELQKAEQEVRRSSVIITDYKQICSQLTKRLEKQQATHREDLDALKNAVKACPRCRHVELEIGSSMDKVDHSSASTATEGNGKSQPGQDEDGNTKRRREDKKREALTAQIRVLEQELAQTKLQMVEANIRIQELEHQKGNLSNDLQAAKNIWFNKTLTSLCTSSGRIHSINLHRDGAPTVSRNIQSHLLSGWKTKKLSWAHRDSRENV
ncbi:hypothetical protein LDENG_00298570 [Lucifuga dentata]|nr:hypothetical protein LDENG_00298570 [Lucifuga dentata]